MAKRLYNVDPIERFNQKYTVDENTGCWNWNCKLSFYGYGVLKVNKKTIKAHRFSYEYFIGPLLDDKIICHTCSNRKCVNPNHLRQDTYKSNSIDMAIDGKCKDQILSVEEVIEIKKSLKCFYRGQVKDLAHFYKVSPKTISAIKTGYSWSHILIP
jgi:hypothetical protein